MKSGEPFTEKLVADETLPHLVEVDGIFVLEKRPGEKMPELKRWQLDRQKTYGATEVLFLSLVRK